MSIHSSYGCQYYCTVNVAVIGFYGGVKLTNKYEVPASFSWKPSEEDSRENAAFYPQHSSGINNSCV